MAGERMRKVNEMLRETISEIISREIDLPLDVFVTITHVDTTRDLKHATVYITVLPDGKRSSTIQFLQGTHGHIQKELGERVKLKFTPRLHFSFDQAEIKAQHIRDTLDSIE